MPLSKQLTIQVLQKRIRFGEGNRAENDPQSLSKALFHCSICSLIHCWHFMKYWAHTYVDLTLNFRSMSPTEWKKTQRQWTMGRASTPGTLPWSCAQSHTPSPCRYDLRPTFLLSLSPILTFQCFFMGISKLSAVLEDPSMSFYHYCSAVLLQFFFFFFFLVFYLLVAYFTWLLLNLTLDRKVEIAEGFHYSQTTQWVP